MRFHLICKTHNYRHLVGPGTLIGELECPRCIDEQDEAYAASLRPCCSRMNIDCAGHEDYDFDSELPVTPVWAIRFGQYGPLTILSPNYCNAPPF